MKFSPYQRTLIVVYVVTYIAAIAVVVYDIVVR